MGVHISTGIGPVRVGTTVRGRDVASFWYLLLVAWWWVPAKWFAKNGWSSTVAFSRWTWRVTVIVSVWLFRMTVAGLALASGKVADRRAAQAAERAAVEAPTEAFPLVRAGGRHSR
jgi:hypothetical protein